MRNNKIIVIAAVMFLVYACAKDKGIHKQEQTSCDLPATVSFSKNIQPLFNMYCNTSGCHSGALPKGNLNLDPDVSFSQLKNPTSGYVDTLNPSFSLLYAQMNSASNPMPPSGKLDKCKIDLILKWIEQKAKNN